MASLGQPLGRGIAFARAWGYGAPAVGNLFAYRARAPAVLRSVTDPVGPGNDLGLIGRGEPRQPRYVPGYTLPVPWT